METRDTRMRKMSSNSIDTNAMQKPYMYIQEQFDYSVESIYRRFITQSDADLGSYPDTFPNNIKEYFWIQVGEARLKSWISLGQLTNGLYFYYTAFSTNQDGKFYVNTLREEVSIAKMEAVKNNIPFKSIIPNMILPGNSQYNIHLLPEIPTAAIPIPINIETETISTIIIVKPIKPVKTGHMNLWLSCRLSDIIEYSMDLVSYEKYISETVPIE